MEGMLQSIIAAGYRQLEGRGLSFYRYDPLSESFPDVWEVAEQQTVRRYFSSAAKGGFTAGVLRRGAPMLVNDTHITAGLSPFLRADIRSFIVNIVRVHGVPWGAPSPAR